MDETFIVSFSSLSVTNTEQFKLSLLYGVAGIIVTDDELVDMVQGKNIHPDLIQAFTNPETGEFNRDQIITYLQNISSMPPQQQAGWYMFERNLEPSRLRLKYDNLLINSNYVTSEEAQQQYEIENSIAEVKYLYIPYYSFILK